MIAADALWQVGGDDTFDLKLPRDFVFYERSFSHYSRGSIYCSVMYIDDNKTSQISYNETQYCILSPIVLSLNEFHTIKITRDESPGVVACSAIVLIYSE